MIPEEAAWLAGLLEGEGCFGSLHRPGGTITWSIICNMTDHDVLEKAAAIIGEDATLNGPYPRKMGSPISRLYVGRRERVRELLVELPPYMCERRSARIGEMLREMEERPRIRRFYGRGAHRVGAPRKTPSTRRRSAP